MLIGNLTRDPELRYTAQGTAIATFGMATNRSWSDSDGNRQEEAEFHRVVAWAKLAEICEKLLFKGRKVYIEGRIQTRKWTGNDGEERETTEIVAETMMVLDNRTQDGGDDEYSAGDSNNSSDMSWADSSDEAMTEPMTDDTAKDKKDKKTSGKKEKQEEETVNVDDIPF